MRLNDPAVLAEVTAAFQVYEKALNANDVATLTALFWKSSLTTRFGIGRTSTAMTPSPPAHVSFLPAQD